MPTKKAQRAKQRTKRQNSAKYSAAPSAHHLARNAKNPGESRVFCKYFGVF
jgi:hypothetical protein